MASRVIGIGIWRRVGRKPAVRVERGQAAEAVSVEQAAMMAPDWGRLEFRPAEEVGLPSTSVSEIRVGIW